MYLQDKILEKIRKNRKLSEKEREFAKQIVISEMYKAQIELKKLENKLLNLDLKPTKFYLCPICNKSITMIGSYCPKCGTYIKPIKSKCDLKPVLKIDKSEMEELKKDINKIKLEINKLNNFLSKNFDEPKTLLP
jgi:hypothetical protein